MEKANVYFTNMRVKAFGENLLGKLEKLMRKAGIEQIDFKDRFAAIKIHFGEYGNLSFLRPNFARTVAEEVKRLGGKPFLTDCNTLYVGSRKHALEHIETAYRNGFTPYSTGCHIIIGDGLKGTDEVSVPVPNGEYVREAKIGRAVMDADIFISLNHFKGHEMTGFGGAIKNIGMGCGSRAGKMEQHCDGKPTVNQELCIGCRNCAKICAHDAPVFHNKKQRSTMRNASAADAVSASARKTQSNRPGDRRKDSSTKKWRNTRSPSSTDVRTFTSVSSWTSLRSATAIRKTMRRSSRTSACSPRSTRSHWIRRAPMR